MLPLVHPLRLSSRERSKDMDSLLRPRAPAVPLVKLSERTSKKGSLYYAGFWGCAKVVLLRTEEKDKFGNVMWVMLAQEPEPKEGWPPRVGQDQAPAKAGQEW